MALSRVHEERYVFSEAKRFQEPEHGGLIYFLRSNENEVDRQSSDLQFGAVVSGGGPGMLARFGPHGLVGPLAHGNVPPAAA